MDSTRLASIEPHNQRDTSCHLRYDAPHARRERPWFWQLIRREPPDSNDENAARR
ncbi:MAG: hypothetical protein KF708_01290 [Pirellulales bacterium]|nr:hypothetical protein [Pirellulales bacterium]